MSKYNVLHLRASNFYGGPERQLHFHARKAKQSEFDISVSSFLENGRIPEFLQVIAKDDVKIHAFDVKNAYDPKSIGVVKSYLKQNNIDILCTHDYRTQVVGWLATMGTKTRWVAFSRGWTAENLKIKLYHLVDKAVIRFADRIVAVSIEQKRKLQRALIPDKKIEVAYNSIDPKSFDWVKRASLRERFNFSDDNSICILGGRFSEEKGQIFLVEAANIALKQNPKLRFVMFGYGPDIDMIKNKIKQYGIEDKVLCPGFEKNLLGYMMDADMLINPSLSEGLPNIVLEAMAFRVPVVATAVGGVPELVDDGESGYLVQAKDISNLAEKIVLLAGNPESQEKFKSNGYETIINRFSFETQADKLNAVYRSVL